MKLFRSALLASLAMLFCLHGGPVAAQGDTLDSAEAATLRYQREFAKYSWDIYRASAAVWGEPVFVRLAEEEQDHMRVLLQLLNHYGVADPVVSYEYWAYSQGFLTEDLAHRMYVGWMLPPAHLRSAAYLEEMSIRDLRAAITGTDESLLIDSYTALLADSYVHLVALASFLHGDPAQYSAKLLSQDDVDRIIAETSIVLANYDFEINPGLNDAWYEPSVDGQGFFVSVFPETRTLLLSWLTYDTELPSQGEQGQLGNPGQRWLTAEGSYSGSEARLVVYSASGGMFREASPVPVLEAIGTIDVQFGGCNQALLHYKLGWWTDGFIVIHRIAADNLALCESLAYPAE
jgi:hypothetical protein